MFTQYPYAIAEEKYHHNLLKLFQCFFSDLKTISTSDYEYVWIQSHGASKYNVPQSITFLDNIDDAQKIQNFIFDYHKSLNSNIKHHQNLIINDDSTFNTIHQDFLHIFNKEKSLNSIIMSKKYYLNLLKNITKNVDYIYNDNYDFLNQNFLTQESNVNESDCLFLQTNIFNLISYKSFADVINLSELTDLTINLNKKSATNNPFNFLSLSLPLMNNYNYGLNYINNKFEHENKDLVYKIMLKNNTIFQKKFFDFYFSPHEKSLPLENSYFFYDSIKELPFLSDLKLINQSIISATDLFNPNVSQKKFITKNLLLQPLSPFVNANVIAEQIQEIKNSNYVNDNDFAKYIMTYLKDIFKIKGKNKKKSVNQDIVTDLILQNLNFKQLTLLQKLDNNKPIPGLDSVINKYLQDNTDDYYSNLYMDNKLFLSDTQEKTICIELLTENFSKIFPNSFEFSSISTTCYKPLASALNFKINLTLFETENNQHFQRILFRFKENPLNIQEKELRQYLINTLLKFQKLNTKNSNEAIQFFNSEAQAYVLNLNIEKASKEKNNEQLFQPSTHITHNKKKI